MRGLYWGNVPGGYWSNVLGVGWGNMLGGDWSNVLGVGWGNMLGGDCSNVLGVGWGNVLRGGGVRREDGLGRRRRHMFGFCRRIQDIFLHSLQALPS